MTTPAKPIINPRANFCAYADSLEVKREELESWAIRHGYTKDRFGHFVKLSEITGDKRRLKITKCSARIERQISIGGRNEWARLSSAYLRDIRITTDDKLSGMSIYGCQPNYSK